MIQARQTKSFTTARKSIPQLVELSNLVVKCCKLSKEIVASWSWRILDVNVLLAKKPNTLDAQNWRESDRLNFLCVIHLYPKFARLCIFLNASGIFQPWTQLGKFTNFKMCALRDVVKDLVCSAWMKIYSIYIAK